MLLIRKSPPPHTHTTQYIILEFMENGALSGIIKQNKFGPFPESLVAVYIQQVLQVGVLAPGGWLGWTGNFQGKVAHPAGPPPTRIHAYRTPTTPPTRPASCT